jgi:hypothetical protein
MPAAFTYTMARLATSLLKKRSSSTTPSIDEKSIIARVKPDSDATASSTTPILALTAKTADSSTPTESIEKPAVTINRQLAERLSAATEPYSYREIALRTGCHQESVRRWLRGSGSDLPAHFIVSVCRTFEINPHWLMSGEGTPSATHTSNQLLGRCAVSDLFAEVVIRLRRAEAAGQAVVLPSNLVQKVGPTVIRAGLPPIQSRRDPAQR